MSELSEVDAVPSRVRGMEFRVIMGLGARGGDGGI